ncbi:MAG: SAM-dependent methyltransferase [Streptosporangiaceae bacterium]|nr:SAM-dependent methyltransferase [Streptosporangiaceae bacterium]MBV9856665.1 SAM-dependent methyltransferase [Streptosporangiaceae bacterium]
MTESSSGPGQKAPRIDPSVPHSARVWNYWLGGKDNYASDRMVGDQVIAMVPDIARIARLQRAFLVSAVKYLAGEAGIRQFLDIGTGLPTANNTHEVAQAIAPESRIVYVDNDPLVLAHARALLTSTPQGACDYIDADVRDPGKILTAAAGTLDFARPVALILLGVLGQIPDSDNPRAIVAQLLDAVPSGSYVALCDGTNTSEAVNEAIGRYNENSHNAYHLRSPEQITGFFDGLELVEPGIAGLGRWRPEATPFPGAGEVPGMCGVGRKP